ncbi:MAG: IPT/TIG domain-containing protein [Deltaproteobacteria bacterium]|nr:IPT/TIG domain-containing protein [Deltaproteobacteria bacterium]
MKIKKKFPSLSLFLAIGALSLAIPVACSENDKGASPDAGTDASAFDGSGGDALIVDAFVPDLDPAKAPKIEQILPADGPADGGKLGKITVTLVGKNFEPTMAAFIDGGVNGAVITKIDFTSPTTVKIDLPPNPYDTAPFDQANLVSLHVQVGKAKSNAVDFQYWVEQKADAKLKGVISTPTGEAYRDFDSAPFEAKVFIEGVTDKVTGKPAQLTAQIGFGRVGEDPRKDYSWRWVAAKWERDEGTDDVISGRIAPPIKQQYDVLFRVSTDGGGHWVYLDTDDTNPELQLDKVAKLSVSDAPKGYCQDPVHCITNRFEKVCDVKTDWKANRCIACKVDGDCTSNPTASGNKCTLTGSGPVCTCAASTDCTTNPGGHACVQTQGGFNVCACNTAQDCDWKNGEVCGQSGFCEPPPPTP